MGGAKSYGLFYMEGRRLSLPKKRRGWRFSSRVWNPKEALMPADTLKSAIPVVQVNSRPTPLYLGSPESHQPLIQPDILEYLVHQSLSLTRNLIHLDMDGPCAFGISVMFHLTRRHPYYFINDYRLLIGLMWSVLTTKEQWEWAEAAGIVMDVCSSIDRRWTQILLNHG
jgi:hypothetical protein